MKLNVGKFLKKNSIPTSENKLSTSNKNVFLWNLFPPLSQ